MMTMTSRKNKLRKKTSKKMLTREELKAPGLAVAKQLEEQQTDSAAIRIQKIQRARSSKRKVEKRKKSIVVIQANARGHSARRGTKSGAPVRSAVTVSGYAQKSGSSTKLGTPTKPAGRSPMTKNGTTTSSRGGRVVSALAS